jgi:SAM-dependent methyltransferase
MRPFLRRRRFDWDWHWRALQAALKAAGPLLKPGGRLVILFSDPDDTLLESVCLAASGAGYVLAGWGYAPEVGYRLVWRWELQDAGGGRQDVAAGVEALERDLMTAVEELAVGVLRERGEPTVWPLLHASAYAGLAERGLLARAATIPEDVSPALAFTANAVRRAFESAPVAPFADQERAGETLWRLADPRQVAEILADRVEAQVWELLRQRPAWSLEELVNAVYARFPGSLTPDLTLVQVCIESYSVRDGGALRSRSEDDPQQRAAELKALRGGLAELGKRLGFKVRQRGHWDVRWLEEGRDAYVFAASATARLGPHLLAAQAAAEGSRRCLVVPGGRAQLIAHKLQRDPRLARAVEADGWQFIKFRHLRRLIAKEELDRHALKTVLGLDPIAEREAAQIPLF